VTEHLPAIVLAGERPGGGLLGKHFGAAANALVPVCGVPSIVRVIETLRQTMCIRGGLISGPLAEVVNTSAVFASILEHGDFRWIAPESGPAESTSRALRDLNQWPVLITTADHALLQPQVVERFCSQAMAMGQDAIVGFADITRVRAAFPHSRRTVLAFADGGRCGTNLFLLRTPTALRIVDFWCNIQAERKRPWRMARRIGMGVLIGYLLGRLRADDALRVLGQLAGCTLGWIDVAEPSAAVDVDSVDDHALAETLLRTRAAEGATSA